MMYSGWMIQEYEYEIPARKFDDHELRIAIQIDKNLLYESFLKIVQYNNDHYRFKRSGGVAPVYMYHLLQHIFMLILLFWFGDCQIESKTEETQANQFLAIKT